MTTDQAAEHAVARLLGARIGLNSDQSFRPRLTRALRDLSATLGLDRDHLVAALMQDPSVLDQLLERVTIQETGFFRHPEQFDSVVRELLPTIGAPLVAWSAACANGQEAYSLAMLFSEAGQAGTVLATDISPAALRRTAEGCYHDREVGGLAEVRRRRHFTVSARGWQVDQRLRDMVVTQRHNLIDPIPARVTQCQIVMCRNVLIYFSGPHATRFLDRLADAMDPAGYLFVGGAETLWQLTDRFEAVQVGASYVYRPLPRGARAHARVVSEDVSTRRSPVASATHDVSPRAGSADAIERAQPIDVSDADVNDDQDVVGQRLLADGLVTQAIAAFRRWSYQCPDDPIAHFQLAIALGSADEHASARRAHRAALAALDRCDPDQLTAVLHGYHRSELRRLLVDRCSDPVPGSTMTGRPQVTS